jgi:ABC-type uncharacterized transport system permease subunit
MGRRLEAFAELLFYTVAYLMFSVAAHEYLHYNVLRMLGGEGHAVFTWFGGMVVIEKLPPEPWAMTLVALAGGVGVGMLLIAAAYWDYISRDFEEMLVELVIGFAQLSYGVYEGMFWWLPRPEYHIYAQIVASIGALAGAAIGTYLWSRSEE